MKSIRIVFAMLAFALLAADGPISITGQILAYQNGFVFFTSGDGFRVATDVKILDYKTKAPTAEQPHDRVYARAVFGPTGTVVELDLSKTELPVEPISDEVAHFAIAASTPYPDPDLAHSAPTDANGVVLGATYTGKPVIVQFNVQVPPTTPFDSQVYISTDVSGWNPQAIPLDRVDSLHFQVTRRINSGTVFNYYYTRGSTQSQERAANGLDRSPRHVIVADADVRTIKDVVYAWADQIGGAQQAQPNTLPTPFNPVPFPNLPPVPRRTAAP